MEEKALFKQTFDYFKLKYPERKMKLEGTLVYIDNDVAFNIDGYSLLYNLMRLCDVLKEELR